MAEPVKRRVSVFRNRKELSRSAADTLVEMVFQTLKEKDHFSFVLSGGTTPQIFYQMLAGEYRDRIPWDHIHLYWGDERYVPQRDPASNFRLFHEAVLQFVHVPLGNIHPMPTHRSDPRKAADDYEAYMRTQFSGEWPRFDAVLLGMGTDGHTASLFPGSTALDEKRRWVVATEVPAQPSTRLTLTLRAINAARHVCFLISGGEKSEVLQQILTGPADAAKYPASGVQPDRGDLVWCVDQAAAGTLEGVQEAGFEIHRYDAGNGV